VRRAAGLTGGEPLWIVPKDPVIFFTSAEKTKKRC
jgi:hypothetical protein